MTLGHGLLKSQIIGEDSTVGLTCNCCGFDLVGVLLDNDGEWMCVDCYAGAVAAEPGNSEVDTATIIAWVTEHAGECPQSAIDVIRHHTGGK